jgi:hypothetical protein
MFNKNKISLDDALEQDSIHTFEGADKQAQELKELKEEANKETSNIKGAGRKRIGKSLTTHKIAFYVNDEQLEYLENMTNKEQRSPNAVAKRLFIKDYEMHSED